jgi:hypothetical protein
MLNTFIKNQGITKTIFHNNNKNYISEINWDADYDGEIAKISLDINDNGIKRHFDTKMNNDEISEIFNIPSINSPIDKRLFNDFLGKKPKQMDDHNMVLIYKIPKKTRKQVKFIDSIDPINPNEIMDTIEHMKLPSENKQVFTHISSPLPYESLIFPLQLQKNTKKTRHHRRHKTKKHRKTKPNYSRRTF